MGSRARDIGSAKPSLPATNLVGSSLSGPSQSGPSVSGPSQPGPSQPEEVGDKTPPPLSPLIDLINPEDGLIYLNDVDMAKYMGLALTLYKKIKKLSKQEVNWLDSYMEYNHLMIAGNTKLNQQIWPRFKQQGEMIDNIYSTIRDPEDNFHQANTSFNIHEHNQSTTAFRQSQDARINPNDTKSEWPSQGHVRSKLEKFAPTGAVSQRRPELSQQDARSNGMNRPQFVHRSAPKHSTPTSQFSCQGGRALPNDPAVIPRTKPSEIWMMPEKYDGKRTGASMFISEYDKGAEYNNWNEATKITCFQAYLSPVAKVWYHEIFLAQYSESFVSWEELKDAFLAYFVGPHYHRAMRDEFNRLRQRENESVTHFFPRVLQMSRIVNPDQTEFDRVLDIKEKLRQPFYRTMMGQRVHTIVHLYENCLELEDALANMTARRARFQDDSTKQINTTEINQGSATAKPNFDRNQSNNQAGNNNKPNWTARPTNKVGMVVEDDTQDQSFVEDQLEVKDVQEEPNNTSDDNETYFASTTVNFMGTLLDPDRNYLSSVSGITNDKNENISTGNNISKVHQDNKLHELNDKSAGELFYMSGESCGAAVNGQTSNTTNAVVSQKRDKEVVIDKAMRFFMQNGPNINLVPVNRPLKVPIAPVLVNDQKTLAMFDSGAERSIIELGLAKKLNLNVKNKSHHMMNANRSVLSISGFADVTLRIIFGSISKYASLKIMVAEQLIFPMILGADILSAFKIEIGMSPPMRLFYRGQRDGIVLAEAVTLPPRSQSLVTTVFEGWNAPTILLLKPFTFSSSVMGPYTLCETRNGVVPYVLINLSSESIKLRAGQQIASLEEISGAAILEQGPLKSDADKMIAAFREWSIAPTDHVNIGSELTDDQANELDKLIVDNISAFSIDGELGNTNLIEHDIELMPDAKPHAEPLRRRPELHKVETAKQCENMEKQGVIERCESPWASAYVVVKKKNGTLRICIDFRKLNSFTKKSSFPLPNIDDCLEPLCGNKYFSLLDLASGYWQIPLSDRAKSLTSFRTEQCQYRFLRMPFGLCNAPASFQRLVNALFAGLKGIHLQVFIDDICVATVDWRSHLELLEKVFKLLITANLKLQPKKCSFGSSSVTFLGHVLDSSGIRPDPDKVKAINDLKPPIDVKGVQRLHGLINYYRRLIPNFAMIAHPITLLLRKKQEFIWGDDQAQALTLLKQALTNEPVLAQFDHHNPIALKTDASHHGVAAILLQRKGSDWRIITCCSRTLTAAEQNWAITDLEGLAIIYAVTKLRNYLLGRHFTILTDHCALCALKAKKCVSPRLQRWALLLSEFDFSIKYVKGSLHNDVDCLSRCPSPNQGDSYLDEKILSIVDQQDALYYTLHRCFVAAKFKEGCCVVVPMNVQNWKNLSITDEEAKVHYERAKKRTKGYKTLNGLLYFEDRLFVPKELRTQIISESHDQQSAGHGGLHATLYRMTEYWWPNMAADVRQYVAACDNCQRQKAIRQRPIGQMQSFHSFHPFQVVGMDIIDMAVSIANRRHIIVAIDHFTKFVELDALDDIRGETCVMLSCSYGFVQCTNRKKYDEIGSLLFVDETPCSTTNNDKCIHS